MTPNTIFLNIEKYLENEPKARYAPVSKMYFFFLWVNLSADYSNIAVTQEGSLSLGGGPRALCAAMNDSSPSAVDVLGLENKEGKRGQGRRVQEGEMR